MANPLIHPHWGRAPESITEGYSLEITASDVDALRAAAPHIPPATPVAITWLPGEALTARVSAALAVRELGFEPMPHFSARRILTWDEFETYIKAVTRDADVRRCFVVAGDPSEPEGPFADSSALLATGAFEENGIRAIGIGGHPAGHPVMTPQQCQDVLKTKIADIEARGMAPLIVTQFGFDADAVLHWLKNLRASGIEAPVRLGVPGPAGIKTLLRYSARCGVSASASVMKKYGVSLANLVGRAGPDKLVDQFAAKLAGEHGRVRLHFYPFGGIGRTVEWINDYSLS